MKSNSSIVDSSLLRGLIENSVVGMIAFQETNGRFEVIFANSCALETLELKSITSVEDLFPATDRVGDFKSFGFDMLKRDGLSAEVLIRKSNQHHFLAALSVKRIEHAGHSVALVSFRDVTVERKLSRDLQAKDVEIERAYQELLEQNTQLKQLDQAKDKFIALTTHELRTPLSAILATADVLELKLYESEEQKEEFIRTISEQGRHLLELVNDVLDFAKIRAGKMEFFVEQIDLPLLLKKTVSNFSHMAVAENIHLDFEIESQDAPRTVWADLLRLKEILNNMMSNAIKYNRTNGRVSICLKAHTHVDGRKFARVMVKDTGVGIPADKLAGVFNEFETIGHVARHHKGTGLGMPISRRLIESMGGYLTLKSQPGVGSEFSVDIPIDKVLAEEFYRSRPDHDSDFAA